MVRSMLSYSKLPTSFWGYVIQMTCYILNHVPTKSDCKTSYDSSKVHAIFYLFFAVFVLVFRLYCVNLLMVPIKIPCVDFSREGFVWYYSSGGILYQWGGIRCGLCGGIKNRFVLTSSGFLETFFCLLLWRPKRYFANSDP